MKNTWFVIINPISGNGKSIKQLPSIKNLFKKYNLKVEIALTQYIHHENKIVKEAINKGYKKFICIGGDGTLHHIINGIMSQSYLKSNKIKVAVIPVGTGNDWVKTYKISNNIKRSVQIIKNGKSVYQDIGCIQFINNSKKYYFNNVAGIGFDAFVVKKVNKIKKIGSAAYLIGGLLGFLHYKKNKLEININKQYIHSKIFMISIGLCQFSGGGLQLTDYKNHKKRKFDITLIKNISLSKVLLHIKKLYNAKIIKLKEVETFQSDVLNISNTDDELSMIQADGELIGNGNITITCLKNSIQFIIA